MPHDSVGLFERGTTYFGPTETIPSSDFGRSVGLEGHEKSFPDVDYSGSPPYVPRSQREVLCRVLRNVSGIVLLAKKGVRYQTGQHGKRVDGYTTTTAERVDAVVDDALPSGGVRNNDLFWGMISGPMIVLNSQVAADANIDEYDRLMAVTAAASTQATEAGAFTDVPDAWSVTETTDGTAQDYCLHQIGIALSARTTADTGGDILADVNLL